MNIYEARDWERTHRKWQQVETTFNEKVAYLTTQFLKQPQIECPLEHTFRDGWYFRRIAIPANTLFIGRPHKLGHRCELLEGSVLHIAPYGRFERHAPYYLHTQPGYQVVLYALTDMVGQSIHPDTGERDIAKIEELIFESVESIRDMGLQIERRLLEAT